MRHLHSVLIALIAYLMLFSTTLCAEELQPFEDFLKGAQEDTSVLGIGSEAPQLDIAHWYSDKGHDTKVEFEKDNVYVVEFWATWCRPCIAGMPHLVELQQQYADRDVVVIGVSDEESEVVEEFLKKPSPTEAADGSKQTYAELTSQYQLTSDPDLSTHNQYMYAAGQNGIPTAFIVGKTGFIEWVGSPYQMDEVLEKVVEGTWDRETVAAEFAHSQFLDKIQNYFYQAISDDKVALAKETIAFMESKTDDKEFAEFAFFFKRDLEFHLAKTAMKTDPDQGTQLLEQFFKNVIAGEQWIPSRSVFFSAQDILAMHKEDSKSVSEEQLDVTLRACQKVLDDAGNDTGIVLNTIGNLNLQLGRKEKAIEYFAKAIEYSEAHNNRNIQWFKEDLKAAK